MPGHRRIFKATRSVCHWVRAASLNTLFRGMVSKDALCRMLCLVILMVRLQLLMKMLFGVWKGVGHVGILLSVMIVPKTYRRGNVIVMIQEWLRVALHVFLTPIINNRQYLLTRG